MLVFPRIPTMTVAALTFLLFGCMSQTGEAGPQATAGSPKEGAKMTPHEPTKSTVDPTKTYEAVIETDKGNIKVKLFAKEAPMSVTNFLQLAKSGFYEGLTFHRVEPGFVIQGGDPAGNGTGGPGYTVPAEIGQPHLKGALAWARTGDEVNPQRRSSGSQFYITLEPTPFLDGGYTVFGQTLEGMEVVAQIRKGDKIKKITIVEK
jgi:cyclophilin family peptidyl-prolyl cis-trans isomerase